MHCCARLHLDFKPGGKALRSLLGPHSFSLSLSFFLFSSPLPPFCPFPFPPLLSTEFPFFPGEPGSQVPHFFHPCQALWRGLWSDDCDILICKLRNMYHPITENSMCLSYTVLVQCVHKGTQCSYIVHNICIQKLLLTVYMFSILQNNKFHRWSCVTYQKYPRTVATHWRKNARRLIKIAPIGAISTSNRSMVQKHPVCRVTQTVKHTVT